MPNSRTRINNGRRIPALRISTIRENEERVISDMINDSTVTREELNVLADKLEFPLIELNKKRDIAGSRFYADLINKLRMEVERRK